MNDFLQLVNARQSDRAYDKSRLVEADKLERILEAGRLAPSACNAQPWRFVVVTDPSLAEKVGKAAAGLGMNKFCQGCSGAYPRCRRVCQHYFAAGRKTEGKTFSVDRYRYCGCTHGAGCRKRRAGIMYTRLVR